MSDICYLGIDTSNYTTSLASVDKDGNIICNLKIPLSVKSGERGLRQSDAVFQHTKNIPEIFSRATEYFENYVPVRVGVSVSPRTQTGSYMPCFLAGKSVAYAIAKTMKVPVCEFSHQSGHIMAAAHSSGMANKIFEESFIAFHVSGGTTEVLYVTPHNNDFKCEIIGGTKDINAGQLIDRIGVVLGLDFPCGVSLEKLALENRKALPPFHVCVDGGFCNFSGAENKAVELYKKSRDKSLVAAYVLEFIGQTLEKIMHNVVGKYGEHDVVYGGGVMSCSILQNKLKNSNSFFAAPALSSDNAVGIALLCRRNFLFD